MAKLTLDNYSIENEFFEGKRLLGIAAPTIPDYRFCWMLNKYLGLQFERKPEMDIIMEISHKNKKMPNDLFAAVMNQPKKERHYFPVYAHEVSNSDFSVLLYCNRVNNNRLIKKVVAADFFILFPDNPFISEFEKINSCHSLKAITWVKEIDPKTLPSKSALIL